MKTVIALLLSLAASLSCSHAGLAASPVADRCSISSSEKEFLLLLPYQLFDQTHGAGWRSIADRGCDLTAALVLDEYVAKHGPTLLGWQARVMTWHAGQMYAHHGDAGLARARFAASFEPHEPPDTPILWNDYVHATIAFLDGDLEKLKRHRDTIAAGPVSDGKRPNLHVVDGLIECFGRPYRQAYGGCRSE